MVIGNGLLAGRFSSFENDDRLLIFAAGVSNSRTRDSSYFNREADTLKKSILENPDKKIVYFSTYSIYDPDENNSVYVKHKLNMEEIVQNQAKQFYILRVSNVAGRSKNRNTILNYFYYHIKNGINFDLWINACRNILDIDDLFFIVDDLLNNGENYSKPVNVGSPVNYPVTELIRTIEQFVGARSNYVEVNKGSCFEMDLTVITPILKKCPTDFNKDYLLNILSKYY